MIIDWTNPPAPWMTPKETARYERQQADAIAMAAVAASERIRGMKADFIIMDDPHAEAAPPLDWRMTQYAGGTAVTPTDHNLPKADYSGAEKRILAHYAAETERAAPKEVERYKRTQDAIRALDDSERDVFNLRFSMDDVEHYRASLAEKKEYHGGCSCFNNPPCVYCTCDIDVYRDVCDEIEAELRCGKTAKNKSEMTTGTKADIIIMDDLYAPNRAPKGGESLYDTTQRKLFEREAEASAEPVYLSQFSDSVFNPTAGAWSGAGRIIDTVD